jgi:hypothetical protein
MSEARGKWGVRGLVEGGQGAGLELGGVVGAAISGCVCTVRAGERLQEGGKGLASGAHGTAS